MYPVLISILQALWLEATSRPILFLLIMLLGSWLLFQKTYVTILFIVLLCFIYIMGDHYGFKY
jgi:hypothetical protein